MLVANPLVLDANASYTFCSYFELRFSPIDILGDLGCSLKRSPLSLPRSFWDTSPLQQRIENYLPYISLTSEAARRQSLVAPILLELAQSVKTPIQIEYPLEVNQYLKGELDYYLNNQYNLIVIEAENDDITRGSVQLAVELIALNLWLAKRQSVASLLTPLTGSVTTGDIWQFSQYDAIQQQVTQDLSLYRIPEDLAPLTQILKGILDQTNSTTTLAQC